MEATPTTTRIQRKAGGFSWGLDNLDLFILKFIENNSGTNVKNIYVHVPPDNNNRMVHEQTVRHRVRTLKQAGYIRMEKGSHKGVRNEWRCYIDLGVSK
jgi:hypothetical protein